MPVCVYVFVLDPDDQGPFAHINAVCKYVDGLRLVTVANLDAASLEDSSEHHQVGSSLSGKGILAQFSQLMALQIRAIRILGSLRKASDGRLVVLQRQTIGMFLLPIYAKLFGIPFVAEVNGLLSQDLVDRKKGFALRWMNAVSEFVTYHLSSQVVSVHENLVPFLVKRYKLSPERLVTIENGTHPREWTSPEDAKARLGIPETTKYVGYLGSLTPREGVDNLLRAIAEVNRQDVRLMVVGGKNDAELQGLRSQADKEGILDRVDFKGFRPYEEAMQLMEACDALVHLRRKTTVGSGDSQGSPLKMLDYHNAGRPVLATHIGSYQYIAKEGFGELVLDGDISGTARAIERILEDREAALDSGRRAHEFIAENKLWEHSVSKLEGLLLRELGDLRT